MKEILQSKPLGNIFSCFKSKIEKIVTNLNWFYFCHFTWKISGIFNKFVIRAKLPSNFSQVAKVWVKKTDTFKNWPLIKNLYFIIYLHETLRKWLPHKVIIFTKFHEDRTKSTYDFFMVIFWTFLIFCYSDLIY